MIIQGYDYFMMKALYYEVVEVIGDGRKRLARLHVRSKLKEVIR